MTVLLPKVSLAKVTARIDRNSIVADETLSLTLSKEGTSFFSNPDLQPLEKDFKILGQSQSSKITSINGKTTSTVDWNIVLTPRRTGTLEIPPISVGKEQSNGLMVEVREAPKSKTKADGVPFFIETDVDMDSVYVQSQAIYSLKLFWAIEARITEPADPHIDGVLVKQLEDATYDKILKGQQYKVFERKYALFPQKSGELEIPSQVIEATVPTRQRSRGFFDPFGTMMGEKIKLRSEPETIQVLEKPDEYPVSAVWLPASELLLKDTWSKGPQELTVGESTTITLSLIADGLMGEQLPPIEIAEPDGIKLYQGKAEVDNTISGNGILGMREESIALIPTRSGTFDLPEIRIPWWNKHLGKIEYAVIPARKIKVNGAASSSASGTQTQSDGQVQREKDVPPPQTVPEPVNKALVVACSMLAVGWLITLYFFIQIRRKVSELVREKSSMSEMDFTLDEKELFKAFSRSCRENNPVAARRDVLTWLNAYFPNQEMQTFSDVAKVANAPGFLDQLNELDRLLYDPEHSSSEWSGALLLEEAKKLKAGQKKTFNKKEHLAQLYK